MRVRDLGTLTVAADTDEQPIVGAKAAAMLARLAINANQRVSVDALMEAAWGDRISSGAASTLTSHVWRLRQLLEPARDRRRPASVLVSDNLGYRLVCSAATLDSLAFTEAAGEVRDLVLAGDAPRAVRRAQAALALWRGTPYGAFAHAHWAQAAVARLEELHGQVQEQRIAALLESGSAGEALSELPPLLAAMPFRQSLHVLQMDALHRTGRGEQALQAYRDVRRLLVDEVGIEPGPELQRLHERILRGEAAASPTRRPVVVARRPVALRLPSALNPLVGRADVVESLTGLVRSRPLVTIIGPAGCGKTRVAVEVARAAADHFPDGVWFVDLGSVSDPDLVAEVIVSTIGLAGSTGATPVQDLRQYLQNRRLLLVLDNCEHLLDGVEQIVRVTVGDPGAGAECCLLATSREPLDIVGEVLWTLTPLALPDPDPDPHPHPHPTHDADRAPALDLFLQRLAAVAPNLPLDRRVVTLAAQIVRAVDGLPLPIELAAARALSHSLDDIAAQATADPTRLSRVGRGPHDHRATVHSTIEWSHRLLSPDEQRAYRRLSVLPGSFTAEAAAVVIDDPADGRLDVDVLLAQLVHRSMLVAEGTGRHRHSAFRQLATVRSHAHQALVDAAEVDATIGRRDRWSAALVAGRPPLGTAAEVAWFGRIDADHATVRATLTRLLVDEPSTAGARLAPGLCNYWYHREQVVEAGRWLQLGQAVVGDADPTDALLVRLWWCCVQTVRRRLDLVRPYLADLAAQVQRTPPADLVAVGEALVVLAMGMYVTEEPALMREVDALLTRVCDAAHDDNLALLTDAVHCCTLLVSGDRAAATTLALSVQERAENVNLMADYISTAPLIVNALLDVRPADGMRWIDRCLTVHLAFGHGSVGMFTETKANFAAQLGDYALATRAYAVSRAVTRRAGLVWPNRSWTRELLETVRGNLSRAEYERAWEEGQQLSAADLIAGVGAPAAVTPPSP